MTRGLSPAVLAAAALELVDAEGLDALSMRRLAARLGVDPMAAYRHLPNKDALLGAIVDAVLAQVDLAGLPGEDWAARLRAGAGRILATLAAHPHAAPLLSERTWATPHGMAVAEWGMAELIGAGIDPHRAAVVMNATGLLLTALASAQAGAERGDAAARLAAVDPARYPLTLGTLAAGQGVRGYAELLDYWLDLVTADLAAHLAGEA